jgi:hypothetical protein
MRAVKVNEATPLQLDWMVAMAEGDRVFRPRVGRPDDWSRDDYEQGRDDRWVVRVQNKDLAYFVDWTYCPSRSWWQAGEIVEREIGNLWKHKKLSPSDPDLWTAAVYHKAPDGTLLYCEDGPTPLTAAMRAYVTYKLGDEVEVPEELCESK